MRIDFFTKNSHLYLFFFIIFALTLFIRLSFVGLVPFWREDGYQYFMKAQEILQGDLTPKLQEMGLPFFYSIFLFFFGQGDMFEDLRVAQILQAIVESLILLPLFLIALRLFKARGALLACLLFLFWPGLIHWTTHGYSESLFIFLALFSFYFLICSEKGKYFLFLASAFAGLAFCVRVTGIFLLPAILFFAYANRRVIPKWKWHRPFVIILVFILVVSPYLSLRFIAHSEFSLEGRAGRYLFTDHYEQWFDPEFDATLSSFLSTHTLRDILSRSWRGMASMMKDLYRLNHFFIILAVLGLLFYTGKKHLAFHFVYLFWFLGLFWIYAVFRSSRFLLLLLPLSIILSAGILAHIFGTKKKAWLLSGMVLVFFVFSYSQNFLDQRSALKHKGKVWKDALSWGRWTEQHIPPAETLAIREGIDIIDMMSPGLKVTTIPFRRDLDQIFDYFKKNGIRYLAVGSGGFGASDWNRIPALKEIRRKSLDPFLVRVYNDQSLGWPMEIFKINWDKKDSVQTSDSANVIEAESITSTDISRYDSEASNEFSVLIKEESVKSHSILLGPVKGIPPGRYRVSFNLKAKGHDWKNFYTQLAVLAGMTGEVLCKMRIGGDAFQAENIYQRFDCFFESKIIRTLNFRITAQGRGELWVDSIFFSRED